jgi:hypothetical protein
MDRSDFFREALSQLGYSDAERQQLKDEGIS